MTTEFAWVIERGDSPPHSPTYWTGPDRWSQDHQDAVRFARKQDAERVACHTGQGYHRVAEHGWHNGAHLNVPTPEVAGCAPLVLFFSTDADRAAFVELAREAKPNMVSRAIGAPMHDHQERKA